jgi:hypothetical protein
MEKVAKMVKRAGLWPRLLAGSNPVLLPKSNIKAVKNV